MYYKAINVYQIRKMQFLINVRMLGKGLSGGPRSKDGSMQAGLDGVKTPLNDVRAISTPKSLEMIE